MYIYIYTYTHTYIYIYVYTCIYIYTYVCLYSVIYLDLYWFLWYIHEWKATIWSPHPHMSSRRTSTRRAGKGTFPGGLSGSPATHRPYELKLKLISIPCKGWIKMVVETDSWKNTGWSSFSVFEVQFLVQRIWMYVYIYILYMVCPHCWAKPYAAFWASPFP